MLDKERLKRVLEKVLWENIAYRMCAPIRRPLEYQSVWEKSFRSLYSSDEAEEGSEHGVVPESTGGD